MTGVIFQLKSDGDYYKLQDHDCFNASKISIFFFFFFFFCHSSDKINRREFYAAAVYFFVGYYLENLIGYRVSSPLTLRNNHAFHGSCVHPYESASLVIDWETATNAISGVVFPTSHRTFEKPSNSASVPEKTDTFVIRQKLLGLSTAILPISHPRTGSQETCHFLITFSVGDY